MRVATWNMQGGNYSTEDKWNRCVMPMLRSADGAAADVCCLQECGAVPDSAVPDGADNGVERYTWGGTSSRPYLNILFYPWDQNGNRCNLAIVSKTKANGQTVAFPAAGPTWRPALIGGWDNAYIASIHAISPGGADSSGLVRTVKDGAGTMNWLVLGDFNREPSSNTTAGQLGRMEWAGKTYSTTNPASIYDYAIVSATLQARRSAVLGQVVFSDHLPAIFDF